jgi:hypothetical protein
VTASLLLSTQRNSPSVSAESPDEKPAHKDVQVIELVARVVEESDLDLDRNGELSQGDQYVFTNDLFRGGEKVGTDGGVCSAVRLDAGLLTDHCTATLSLPRGQITAQWLITLARGEERPIVAAITGGTGAYRTAHGELVAEAISEQEVRLTLKLIL